jgi:cysteine synthase
VSDPAQRAFWESGTIYDDLQRGLVTLSASVEPAVITRRLRAAGYVTPDGRTLAKFLSSDGPARRTLIAKPDCLNALLLVGEKIRAEHGLGPIFSAVLDAKAKWPTSTGNFPAPRPKQGSLYNRDRVQLIIDNIPKPRSANNPRAPEFPPRSPRFPATPTIECKFEDGTIGIKDESVNPTGSHKDRWAWEMLLQYKATIETLLNQTHAKTLRLPEYSMISSGSAALALQSLLNFHGLPGLRVVMDENRTPDNVISFLESIGARVIRYNLETKEPLTENDVLRITDNDESGTEITTRNAFTPNRKRFYDWLVCEILRQEPQHIYVPFGTGDLFANIVYFIESETTSRHLVDPRLISACRKGINVHGATTDEPRSRMDKLYAKWRPTLRELRKKIKRLKNGGILGGASEIETVDDKFVEPAMKYAESNGIPTEESGIAGLALLMQHRESKHRKRGKILVVNTGRMCVPG